MNEDSLKHLLKQAVNMTRPVALNTLNSQSATYVKFNTATTKIQRTDNVYTKRGN